MQYAGLDYKDPEVTILHITPLSVAEIAARTCYDSFDKAEYKGIKEFPETKRLPKNDIGNSKLVEELAHVFHHASVIEHVYISIYIKTIRGVLQEHARHRVASLSVKSTRYTMSDMLIACLYFYDIFNGKHMLAQWIVKNDIIGMEDEFAMVVAGTIAYKLFAHIDKIGLNGYYDMICSRELREYIGKTSRTNGKDLEHMLTLKKKRNMGDGFKYLVDDMWNTELVWTINLRSLENYLKLRDSGAAWFMIREVAREVYRQLPEHYQRVVRKPKDK